MGSSLVKKSVYLQVYGDICQTVYDNIYIGKKSLTKWFDECLQSKNNLPLFLNEKIFVQQVREDLEKIKVSHLGINTPIENKIMWQGLRTETGIESVGINGRYFVFENLNKEVDIRFGDQIVSINGDSNINWEKVKFRGGLYRIRRNNQILEIRVTKKEIKIDSKPRLVDLGDKNGLLLISSYRPEFFEQQEIIHLSTRLSEFNHVIVDLRKNLGGNVVAMLRSLSSFICDQQLIGILGKENEGVPNNFFDDDLSDELHFNLIQKNRTVGLKTFPTYQCFKGKVSVLVSESTGSVAEIFAQAIKATGRGQVIGEVTSGQVLLAVWYPIDVLREGFTLSIPIANYYDTNKVSYEGLGVEPDQYIYFAVEDMRAGVDTFIKTALTHTAE